MKTLEKYHHTLAATYDTEPPIPVWVIDDLSNGWTQPAPSIFVSSTYFDLGGLAMDEKTLFPEGIALQEPGPMQGSGTAGEGYIVYDLMTSVPINFADLTSSPTPVVVLFAQGFGFPGGYLESDQVLYARTRVFAMDLDFGASVFVKSSDNQYGSMQATASDRIYSYRIVISKASPGNPDTLYIPPARHMIQMSAREEPEFQYLMRLKRSYDLQQSPDVD